MELELVTHHPGPPVRSPAHPSLQEAPRGALGGPRGNCQPCIRLLGTDPLTIRQGPTSRQGPDVRHAPDIGHAPGTSQSPDSRQSHKYQAKAPNTRQSPNTKQSPFKRGSAPQIPREGPKDHCPMGPGPPGRPHAGGGGPGALVTKNQGSGGLARVLIFFLFFFQHVIKRALVALVCPGGVPYSPLFPLLAFKGCCAVGSTFSAIYTCRLSVYCTRRKVWSNQHHRFENNRQHQQQKRNLLQHLLNLKVTLVHSLTALPAGCLHLPMQMVHQKKIVVKLL